ncbi:hypothetical protein [Paracoccus sp. AS002]|uniref:hypothetical protein n=1 Tax=Paracoccus sp. AS002 TaxID=3019545 RepID=UPI0023E8A447|nr:hypothetical protein [Paracoccus sp. AS002]MDF3904651.1 hypothetical protein [Paracoccus sp. AS002]
MPSDEMPERIWAFEDYPGQGAVPRGGMWCDEQSETPDGSPCFIRSDLCASGQQVRALDVDDLAQIIRVVDGNNTLGAGELAEAILEAMPVPRILAALTPAPQPSAATPTAQEAVPACAACEDNPKHPNIPCAVCGAHPPQPSETVAEAVAWAYYWPDGGLMDVLTTAVLPHETLRQVPLYAHPPQPSETVAEALSGLMEAYKEIADSGDAGFWKAEETPEYQAAVAALRALKGGDA